MSYDLNRARAGWMRKDDFVRSRFNQVDPGLDARLMHNYIGEEDTTPPKQPLPPTVKWYGASSVRPRNYNRALQPVADAAPQDDALQFQPPMQSQINGVMSDPIWTRPSGVGGVYLVRVFIGPRQSPIYHYANPVTGEIFYLYAPIDRNAI